MIVLWETEESFLIDCYNFRYGIFFLCLWAKFSPATKYWIFWGDFWVATIGFSFFSERFYRHMGIFVWALEEFPQLLLIQVGKVTGIRVY